MLYPQACYFYDTVLFIKPASVIEKEWYHWSAPIVDVIWKVQWNMYIWTNYLRFWVMSHVFPMTMGWFHSLYKSHTSELQGAQALHILRLQVSFPLQYNELTNKISASQFMLF